VPKKSKKTSVTTEILSLAEAGDARGSAGRSIYLAGMAVHRDQHEEGQHGPGTATVGRSLARGDLDPADLPGDPFYLDELEYDSVPLTSAAGARSIATVLSQAWAELAEE
jgi:hypothetical protein